MINLAPKIVLAYELFRICLHDGEVLTFSLSRLAENTGFSMTFATLFFIIHAMDPIVVFASTASSYALFLEMRMTRIDQFPLNLGLSDHLLRPSRQADGSNANRSGHGRDYEPFTGRGYSLAD